MPIGNQNIWDKGIGAGATNVIFGQQPQPAPTNFNPGALGADPNSQSAVTTATGNTADPSGEQAFQAWDTETQGAQWDQGMVDQGFVWTKNGETGKFEWMTPDQIAEAKRKSGYGWQFRRPNGPTGAGGHR